MRATWRLRAPAGADGLQRRRRGGSVLLGCPLSHDCTGEASVELNGQSLGTTQFSLTRGSYAFIYVPLAGRSSADYMPPIDDAILHIGTRRYPAATIPDFYLPLELDL
jgi:hypothetical protein